ncbi:MAG: hypothetical protein M1485_06985 [Chloroflexi bacterium]|nr:hypothetical protein [Chloroflexota bacterium]
MRVGEIRQFWRLQDEGQSLMRSAMTRLNLSARGYHRALGVARTIADLAGSEEIQSVHLTEALQYRPKIVMGCPTLSVDGNARFTFPSTTSFCVSSYVIITDHKTLFQEAVNPMALKKSAP